MCMSSPDAPPPPPEVPEAPRTPDVRESLSTQARDAARRRRAAGGSTRSTILTSPQGVASSGAGVQKTLLGQ